jgi:hypothetical protein
VEALEILQAHHQAKDLMAAQGQILLEVEGAGVIRKLVKTHLCRHLELELLEGPELLCQ